MSACESSKNKERLADSIAEIGGLPALPRELSHACEDPDYTGVKDQKTTNDRTAEAFIKCKRKHRDTVGWVTVTHRAYNRKVK